jgi:hypothetical protein
MTDDERAERLLAKLAPDWREHLNDGRVLDHIVTVLCFPANEARRRKLKVNAYNRKYHLKRARGRQRQKAASA